MARGAVLLGGGLAVLCAAKLGFGLLALGGDTSFAAFAAPEPAMPALAELPAGSAEVPLPTQVAGCDAPAELLAAIDRERVLLDKQKAEIATRAAETDLAHESIKTETAQLEELRATVQALLDRASAQRIEDLDKLVALYKGMKPNDAATIMNELDLEVSVLTLAEMDERSAARIMAKMKPDRVRAISKIIMERSKMPGDQRPVQVRVP
ncbi:MotE family protein [Frigidibacter sp. MR17.24]|uniref:MotE family protein n=1 Tax=Frigidibacter sp. MR17.24 TaxID=3127345 RepID=UPI003012F030